MRNTVVPSAWTVTGSLLTVSSLKPMRSLGSAEPLSPASNAAISMVYATVSTSPEPVNMTFAVSYRGLLAAACSTVTVFISSSLT